MKSPVDNILNIYIEYGLIGFLYFWRSGSIFAQENKKKVTGLNTD